MDEERAFDPRAWGSKCDSCALGQYHRSKGDWAPVCPEVKEGAERTVVGRAPSKTSVKHCRPFSGMSGEELGRGLNKAANLGRRDANFTYAVLCGLPKGDAKLWGAIYKKMKRARKAKGLEPWLDPVVACRGQVLRVARSGPVVLALGSWAHKSLVGRSVDIHKTRGSFMTLGISSDLNVYRKHPLPATATKIRLVTTRTPGAVLMDLPQRILFDRDIKRWDRWVNNELRWRPAVSKYIPTPDQVARFLQRPELAYDVETDDIDPTRARLRCIGISDKRKAILIPFLSIFRDVALCRSWADLHGMEVSRNAYVLTDLQAAKHAESTGALYTKGAKEENHKIRGFWYSDEDGAKILSSLKDWYIDRKRVKQGHNAGYYDALNVLIQLQLPRAPMNLEDSILYMRACYSELKRDLHTTATLHTDVGGWKADADEKRNIATHARTNMELWAYCVIDNLAVARSLPKLKRRAARRKQARVLKLDHRQQAVYAEIKKLGIPVDQKVRRDFEDDYQARADKALTVMRDMLGDPKFKPTPAGLTKLFYDDWKLPILRRTDANEPVTDDAIKREFLAAEGLLSESQVAVLRANRRWSKLEKALGTYIRKFRMWNDLRLNSAGKLVGGICRPDGRIYGDYNVASPATGRVSSSGPNMQNLIKDLRRIFQAPAGMVFVGADYDAVELRIFAVLANLKEYKHCIMAGGDPHSLTASKLYGEPFLAEMKKCMTTAQWARWIREGVPEKCGRVTKKFKSMRDLAKTWIYATMYGGTSKTIYTGVSSAENSDGTMMFPDMTLADIDALGKRFLRETPEMEQSWQETWDFVTFNQYVKEPLVGRRRDAPVLDRNMALNHPIQGYAAVVMSRGLIRLRRRLPPNMLGPGTGIVNQCHDAVATVVPERDADWVAKAIEESLTQKYHGMTYSVEADIATNLADAA